MKARIFWVLAFIFLILPAWADDFDDEIILLEPDAHTQRFINIKKRPTNYNQSGTSVVKGQSFKINENINNVNQFKMKLDYDTSGVYASKEKRIDELSVEYKGKLNDRFEYRANIIGNNIHTDTDNQRVYTNSYIGAKLNKHHKLYLGGARLSETTSSKVGFLNDLESTYGKDDLGGKLQGRLEKFDYSLGAYKNFGEDNSYSRGGVFAYKPFGEKSKYGKWSLGSAYYGKNQSGDINNTYGAFSHYKYYRFGIKNEYARSYHGNNDNYEANWSFAPEYYLTKNLILKTKHRQWQQTEGYANDFILEYALKENKLLKINNLKLQLKASYIKSLGNEAQRRVGVTSRFSF